MRFAVQFKQTDQRFAIDFDSDKKAFNIGFKDAQLVTKPVDEYEGEYEVTPKDTKQIMLTKGKLLAEDITINPIPERYGLITYDHNRTITVS